MYTSRSRIMTMSTGDGGGGVVAGVLDDVAIVLSQSIHLQPWWSLWVVALFCRNNCRFGFDLSAACVDMTAVWS